MSLSRAERRRARRAQRSATITRLGRRSIWKKFKNWVEKVTKISESFDDARTYYWQDSFPIFNSNKECKNETTGVTYTANLAATLQGSVQINWKYGMSLQGQLVPAKIDTAYIYFDNDLSTSATFTLSGKASVEWESSRQTFLSTGFPGLTVPGIITIGPTFSLDGYVSGGVSLEGQLVTTASYQFPTSYFAMGTGAPAQSSGGVNPISAPSGFSTPTITAGVQLSANAELHIVPRLELGISLIDGKLMNAQAYIEADLFAGVGANATVGTNQPPQFCLSTFAGIAVETGLTGSVLYIEGDVGPWTLYSNQFDIYAKCWKPTSKRSIEADSPARELPSTASESSLTKRWNLPGNVSCPK